MPEKTTTKTKTKLSKAQPRKRIVKKVSDAKKVVDIPIKKVKMEDYLSTIGRRKTAVARVRLLSQGNKEFNVNNKPYKKYFPTMELQYVVLAPLELMGCLDKFGVSAVVRGGGPQAQAEALRHGISRALVLHNATFKKRLKKMGYLTRDPRMRERKKFGLKRARRAPQWQKR